MCVRERSECYSNCLIWRSQNTEDSLKGAVKALCGTQGFRYTKQMLLSTAGLKRHSQLKYRLYIFPRVTISQTPHWSFEKLMFIILVCVFSCSNNNFKHWLTSVFNEQRHYVSHLYLTFSDYSENATKHKKQVHKNCIWKASCWWSADKLIILRRFIAYLTKASTKFDLDHDLRVLSFLLNQIILSMTIEYPISLINMHH